MMNLRYAFAVGNDGNFQNKHFGDAEKYIIFEHDSKSLVFTDEINNTNKNIDEETKHGSKKKGNAVIDFLKNINVNVLVSRQFGKNIKMINKHFIPVLAVNDTIDDVIKILEKESAELNKELNSKKTDFNIFRLTNGILNKN